MNFQIPAGIATKGAAVATFLAALAATLLVIFTPGVSTNDMLLALGTLYAAVPPLTVAFHGRMKQAEAAIYRYDSVLSVPIATPVVPDVDPEAAPPMTAVEHLAAATALMDPTTVAGQAKSE